MKEEKKEMGNEEKKTEKNMELTMCDVSIYGCILDGRQESASLVMDDAGISRIKGMEYTGCFKKNCAVFILQISWQPSIGFSNRFFLLKTEIHM